MRRTCPGPFEICYVMKCADEEVPCRVGVRKRVLYPVLEEGALSRFRRGCFIPFYVDSDVFRRGLFTLS
jgi:hypothetical protein